MMWQPPPPPPHRIAAVIAQQRRIQHDQMMRGRIKGLHIPMAANVVVRRGPTISGAPGEVSDGVLTINGKMGGIALAHEYGHVLDDKDMTDADRQRMMTVMGLKAGPWNRVEKLNTAGQMVTAHDSPSEIFADYVGLLGSRRIPRPNQNPGLPYLENVPSLKRLLRVGRALERMGKRYNLPRYVEPR